MTALHIASCVDEAKYVWNLETLDARHYLDGRLMIADVFTAEFRALQAALFAHLGMHGDGGDTGGDAHSGGARLRDALDACGENEALVALFAKAIDAHLEVLARHKAGMESYLHLFLLTNEMGTLPVPSPPKPDQTWPSLAFCATHSPDPGGLPPAQDHPPHALTDNPTYEATYRHHIVGSNLGNDAGMSPTSNLVRARSHVCRVVGRVVCRWSCRVPCVVSCRVVQGLSSCSRGYRRSRAWTCWATCWPTTTSSSP